MKRNKREEERTHQRRKEAGKWKEVEQCSSFTGQGGDGNSSFIIIL